MQLTEEPWGFLLLNKGAAFNSNVKKGDGTPALFCSLDLIPEFEAPYGQPVRLGFPFLWNDNLYQAWHLPTSNKKTQVISEFSVTVKVDRQSYLITQEGITPRPSVLHPLPQSESLDLLIRWMSHGFQELAHEKLTDLHAKLPGQVRRTWEDVDKVWLKPDLTEPRMELIVRLSQDMALRGKLESISISPRRILKRIRTESPVSNVQELDSICIRNLAQRPGKTYLEKAGPRQSLLAVQRRTSHDTLENRVAVWVLEAISARAAKWVNTHIKRINSGSRRALAVKRFGKKTNEWRLGEALNEVVSSALNHPVQANYPLLLDIRYKSIYSTYLELLKYHRVEDDAWTWRRVLWSETVKQLIICSFNNSRDWDSGIKSYPYYRVEPDRGTWTGNNPTPGPFLHPKFGEMVLLDARETHSTHWIKSAPATWLKYAGVLGCEMIIWWPTKNSASVVWSNVGPKGNDIDWRDSLNRAVSALNIFRGKLNADNISDVKLSGLVIQTARSGGGNPGVDIETVTLKDVCVVGLSLPQEVDKADQPQFEKIVKDFHAGIKMTMDYANG